MVKEILFPQNGATFQLGDDPLKAVYRADVIITDSMGCPDGGVEAKYLINRKVRIESLENGTHLL